MFDHMGLGTADYQRATAFYDAALAPLGIRQLYVVPKEFTNGVDVVGYGRERPMFWVAGQDPPRASCTSPSRRTLAPRSTPSTKRR